MSTYRYNGFVVSTVKSKLNKSYIHQFLKKTYWAKGISYDEVEESIKNSYCFGLYFQHQQIGFARVVTDYVRFAYICDVFVDSKFQRHGLGKWLVYCLTHDKKLSKVKGWLLATQDAHAFYRKFGFHKLQYPGKYMQRRSRIS